MRQPNIKTRLAQAEARAADGALAREALHLALTVNAEYTETISHDTAAPGTKYELACYGFTRANGGLVITRFVCRGQYDSISVEWVDAFIAPARHANPTHYGQPFAEAAGRISAARHAALDRRTRKTA